MPLGMCDEMMVSNYLDTEARLARLEVLVQRNGRGAAIAEQVAKSQLTKIATLTEALKMYVDDDECVFHGSETVGCQCCYCVGKRALREIGDN